MTSFCYEYFLPCYRQLNIMEIFDSGKSFVCLLVRWIRWLSSFLNLRLSCLPASFPSSFFRKLMSEDKVSRQRFVWRVHFLKSIGKSSALTHVPNQFRRQCFRSEMGNYYAVGSKISLILSSVWTYDTSTLVICWYIFCYILYKFIFCCYYDLQHYKITG